MKRLITGLLITLACAAAGGALAWWLASPAVAPDPPVTERALAAAAGLGDGGHVYVDPSAQGAFTAAEVERLDAAAAASDPAVFLVVWPNSDQAGYGSRADVLRQIGDVTGRPGLYVEVSPGEDLYSADVGIEGDYVSSYGDGGSGAAGLLDLIGENDGREYSVGEDTGSHYWGGTGGIITAGLLIGGFSGIGAGLLGLGGWALARRRKAAA